MDANARTIPLYPTTNFRGHLKPSSYWPLFVLLSPTTNFRAPKTALSSKELPVINLITILCSIDTNNKRLWRPGDFLLDKKIKLKAMENVKLRSSTELRAAANCRLGYYTSIYAKDYLSAHAVYEMRRKNWTVENIDNGFYLVKSKIHHTDPDGTSSSHDEIRKVYYTYGISGCDCEFFTTNQIGTCPHLEAVKASYIVKGRSSKVIWVRYFNGITLCANNHTKSKELTNLEEIEGLLDSGFIMVPGVAEYLQKIKSPVNNNLIECKAENLDILRGIHLRDYQKESIMKMLNNGGRSILTLQMGLGKTICALVCCKMLRKERVIIICPNTLKYQWQSEIKRFKLGSTYVITKGTDFEGYNDERFLIVNYEILNRNKEFLKTRQFDIAVIDEIQKIKNGESKTWATISKLRSEYIFALSGTPIQNNVSDLISVIKILDPSKLIPEWKFYEKYCILGRTRINGWNPERLKELKKELDYLIINPDIDYSTFPLPKKNEYTHKVTIDKFQQQIHDNCMNQARILLAQGNVRPLTFSQKAMLNGLLLKARRAVTDPRLVGGKNCGSRVERTIQLISDLTSSGKKVVVYSEWIDTLNLIREQLDLLQIGSVSYTGEVKNFKRSKNINDFINDEKIMVFLSTDSGGLGVDGLQLASHTVIHMEHLWNPMKMEQRNGRLIRLLQYNEEVDIHHFNSNSGVEEMIFNTNNRKYVIINEMFGGNDAHK